MKLSKEWQAILVSWVVWQFSFAILYHSAWRIGLDYQINQLVLWKIFGTPDDIYSFRNLFLPKLLTFPILSVAPTLLGLVVYRCYPSDKTRISIWFWGFALGFLIIPPLIEFAASIEAAIRPATTLVFLGYILVLTVILFWVTQRTIHDKSYGAP